MHFAPSEDQQMVASAARDYLSRLPGARAFLEGQDPTPDGWAHAVDEQSWPLLLVPEQLGGFGLDQVTLALVLEELGQSLVPLPLLGVAWATVALLECAPSEVRDAALVGICEGKLATVVWAPDLVLADRLSGVLGPVVEGADAELFVVVTQSGVALVEPSDDAAVVPLPTLDATRGLATLHLSDVAVTPLACAAPDRIRARCMALLACECVGVAEAVMTLAVDYAKVREQFGGPIGRFQAVQHLCADMLVAVESARSAAWYAAWATDPVANTQDTELERMFAAQTGLATAADAAFFCASMSIQVHGGIGFTWEHVCHLYFKRARQNRTLLGEPRRHRAAVADTLLGSL